MSENKNVADQHAVIGNSSTKKTEFDRTTHPGAEWFYHPVQLGLFVHYGISTVADNCDLSWSMFEIPDNRRKGKGILTPREYWKLAERFNPQNFDPEKWLQAAKDAGFTYAVFTTKHHDGFSLWPSEVGDFSTKNYMNGRDLVREYVDACRKVGLKVGLYYSPPDWRFNQEYMSFMQYSRSEKFPDRPHKDIDHLDLDGDLPQMSPEHYEAYIDYMNTQVRELLTNYGQIDLMWFDGSVPDHSKAITIEEMRKLQPQIVVNDRLWGWGIGDYCSRFECHLPKEKPEMPWETTHIWHVGAGWAYVRNSDIYRDINITMQQYETCKKWGGNLLLNIAPDADGVVPQGYYNAAKELAEAIKEYESSLKQ